MIVQEKVYPEFYIWKGKRQIFSLTTLQMPSLETIERTILAYGGTPLKITISRNLVYNIEVITHGSWTLPIESISTVLADSLAMEGATVISQKFVEVEGEEVSVWRRAVSALMVAGILYGMRKE